MLSISEKLEQQIVEDAIKAGEVPILPYFTAISLDLPADFSAEAASAYLTYISTAHKACGWWLADYMLDAQNRGEQRWSEALSHAKELGYSLSHIQNAMSVARKFPKTERWGLSFSHHAEVRPLPIEDARKLLEMAQAEEWSVSELKAAKKGGGSEKDQAVEAYGAAKGGFKEGYNAGLCKAIEIVTAANEQAFIDGADELCDRMRVEIEAYTHRD